MKTNRPDATYYVKGKFYQVLKGSVLQTNLPKEVAEFFGTIKQEKTIETPVVEEQPTEQVETSDELATLQARYEETVGKLPARYKNDAERIKSKLLD